MPTVLVTSSSRGIGREFVRQYAADGWRVMAGCRPPETVEGRSTGHRSGVRPIAMDVTDVTAVEAVAREDQAPVDCWSTPPGIGQGDDGPGKVNRGMARVIDVNTWDRCGCSTRSPTGSPPQATRRPSR